MAKALKAQLPAPADQNDFEDLCEAIAREYWRDPTAERFGNQGHEQYGIDIMSPLAQEAGESRVLAIQCKKKKLNTGRKLSKADIDGSLEKAEKLTLKLSRLMVATTSSKDTNIQTHIATINIDRDKKGQFPVAVWFWEDIEKILQEKCPNTYLDYLMSLLPEGGKAAVSKDLLVEALRVAEELVKDNYIERAKGVLSVLSKQVSQLNDPEIEVIASRIEALLLVRDEKSDEATTLLLDVTTKHKRDIHSWALLFDRYVEKNNLKDAEKILKTMQKVDENHPLTRNAGLIYKLHADQEIEYPEDKLEGAGKENATAYLVYHLYANKKKDKKKRDFYLERQKEVNPNASTPISFDIIYKVSDLLEDLDNISLAEVESVWSFVLEKEKELETKNPLALTQDINITVEKLRLDVLVLQNFKPRHEITASLKEDAISKICKSYFDYYVYHKLLEILRLMPFDRQELSKIVEYLKKQNEELKPDLANLLLAHALFNDSEIGYAEKLCEEISLSQQKDFLKALKNKEIEGLVAYLKDVHVSILHPLIAAISDFELGLEVINNLGEIEDEQTQSSLTHMKIFYLTQREGENLLEEIKKEIQFDKQGFHLLNEVSGYAESKKFWDIEAECLRYMLKFELSDKERVQIETRLAVALFKLEDCKGVLENKDYILKNLAKLHQENQKVAIKVLVLSAIKAHQLSLALEILKDTFSIVEDEFEFHFYKADVEIKLEQYEDALETILEGLRKEKHVSRDMYQACFMLLNDLTNAELIKNEGEKSVTDNVYIKISGIDSWFYIGNKKEIDAIKLASNDERYAALWEQNASSEIDWPQDQYKKNLPKRKIELIASEPVYIRVRSQEILNKAVEEGSPHIWAVDAEDPEQGIENMKMLWEQMKKPSEDFFKDYTINAYPFSFLANVEGGMGNAISKICTKQEGFIHINDGTDTTQKKQIQAAHDALDGAPLFIDAISLLFLINADLHEVVSENVEQLYYTPSVSGYIREHASRYAQSRFQMGRISFGKNMEVIPSDYDHKKELEVKNSLLEAVEYFEAHATKETSDFLSSKKVDIESLISSGISDPFSAARSKGVNIISDDYFYHRAIEILSREEQPFPISSMAMVKALHDREKITWDAYLDYVSWLLNYRCKHITISPNIMQDVILAKSKGGIVTVQPKNIRKLHLDVTLSVQYGVTPELAADIISGFLIQLIQDPAITFDTLRQILAEFLIQALKGRDKRFGDYILSRTKQAIEGTGLIVPVTDRDQKFEIVDSQINTYFAEFNPLYDSIPLILARSSQ